MRHCVWCEADLSAPGAAALIPVTELTGRYDWECADRLGCERRTIDSDAAWGLVPSRHVQVVTVMGRLL